MRGQTCGGVILETGLALIDQQARLRILVPGLVVAGEVEEDQVQTPITVRIERMDFPRLGGNLRSQAVGGIGEAAAAIVDQQAVDGILAGDGLSRSPSPSRSARVMPCACTLIDGRWVEVASTK